MTPWTHGKFFKYKKPLEIKCGIKSRTARGHVYGSNWWSRRWIEVLERCIDAGRIARGKSYARKGQVVNIGIEPGLVTAFVQGMRREPYQIRLGFKTVSQEARDVILFRFRENAALTAKLLACEMPVEIEGIFKDAQTPLFPSKDELHRFKCTCPDDAVPCKHIIAVLLILGEELEENPFILLNLRGLDKESMINQLTFENISDDAALECTAVDNNEIGEGELIGGADKKEEALAPVIEGEGLPIDENWFRGGDFSFEHDDQDIRRHSIAIDVMNDFPFWRGERPFRQTLMPIYERAATFAGEILTGEKKKPVGRPRKLL